MPEIKMSFWNYQRLPGNKVTDDYMWNKTDIPSVVADWKELGMNYPQTFVYNPQNPTDKEQMIKLLDECQRQGIKVFLSDERVRFVVLRRKGEEEFRKLVQESLADFGSHPAVYGYLMGDEPANKDFWLPFATNSVKIFKEYAPHLKTYLNMLPYWGNENGSFEAGWGVPDADGYGEILSQYIKESGVDILSYDYYGQCCYFDREHYIDIYYQNLRALGKAARENGIELYNCPLAVEHMSTRAPNENEVRWQINTSVASGVTGMAWFSMYGNGYSNDFTLYPYDFYYKKTSTYEYMSRQCRIFMDNHAKHLKDYHFVWAKHVNKVYGGWEEFKPDDEIKSLRCEINTVPLIVTRFENDKGEITMGITNNSQTEPTYIEFVLGGKLGQERKRKVWLAPGMMLLCGNCWI